MLNSDQDEVSHFMVIRHRNGTLFPEVGYIDDHDDNWKWVEFVFTKEKKDKYLGTILEERSKPVRVKQEEILWVKEVDSKIDMVDEKYHQIQWREMESNLKKLANRKDLEKLASDKKKRSKKQSKLDS